VDTPALRTVPHHKWMETLISFDASDCPKNMPGARQLPLLISLTIANIRLYHILVDGGADLKLISLIAFKKLQIPMWKLAPSRPFSGVGPGSVMPRGSISRPVMFGTPENYRTKSILFDIVEVNLPFNTILGRLAMYQFMVVVHYGYLVLKMPSPNNVIKIRRDHMTCVSALEKLQTLAAVHEAATGRGDQDPTPSSSLQHGSTLAPCVQPSNNEGIHVKIGTCAHRLPLG
jgi:hypothetical protein